MDDSAGDVVLVYHLHLLAFISPDKDGVNSAELLFSKEARLVWVEPDLAPLPD